MSTAAALENLRSRILSDYSILMLKTWEEERWENELATLCLEMERGLVAWSATGGPQPPPGSPDEDLSDPLEFLKQLDRYPPEHVFLLKDFHPFFNDPRVVRKLRDLVGRLSKEDKTLLFIGPEANVPMELEKEVVRVDLPLPGMEELRDVLAEITADRDSGVQLELDADQEEKLLRAVLGLTMREAKKALTRSLLDRTEIDDDCFAMLVSEKKHMVQGSDMLEFYDLEEGLGQVGGLDGLKDWLGQRAEAFGSRAQEQGIPSPKGMLLLGVQGCGKSLTARATARLLGFPLVRLDLSNLLSSDRGASERNMRDVIHLMETIAPAVLWLDEIEKGFAGTSDEGIQDATMSRILGGFLTWMEERRAPVFVVATANSIVHLPPELMRRGRFDEMFFVDLPNFHERQDVFKIHLARHGWKPEKFDVEMLASRSEGYSGAEIEQIVIAAMIDAYGKGKIIDDKALDDARDATVPLSVTMEEKIFNLREWARERCRPATYDSRVLQMLEQEERQGSSDLDEEEKTPEWIQLAEHGQLNAAVTDYVRTKDNVTFPSLQRDFAQFLDTEGDVGLALRSDPNVVLWVGMSEELAGVVAKLIQGKRLYVHPAGLDRYEQDRESMRLKPVEELPEDERLPKPAWFPACLRDLPPEGGSGRFARVARMKLSK